MNSAEEAKILLDFYNKHGVNKDQIQEKRKCDNCVFANFEKEFPVCMKTIRCIHFSEHIFIPE